jgi:hypothetical protein
MRRRVEPVGSKQVVTFTVSVGTMGPPQAKTACAHL